MRIGQEQETKRSPLIPEPETLFRISTLPGQVQFERDAAGAVVGVHLYRGGDAFAERLPG